MPEEILPAPTKKRRKWLWLPVFLLAAGAGVAAVMLPRGSDDVQSASSVPVAPEEPLGVGCRGRIEPEDRVIHVAAPALSGRPPIIAELRVKEGEAVRSGQVLAVLDERDRLERTLRQNEAEIEVARKKLAQVKAGAKLSDVDAQKMEIARWESEHEIATNDFQRYQRLRETQNVSAADLDQKRLIVERARRTLDAAKERLKSIEQIRKEDVDLAAAELDAALARAEQVRGDIERTVIRAPHAGRVLKIRAYPGEEVGPAGILELGKTSRMYVIAEVYENDIGRVRVGQKATISGELLDQELAGTVSYISPQVTRTELLPIDTVSFADTRVIQVKVQLENSERAAGLIYGKVNVVIHP